MMNISMMLSLPGLLSSTLGQSRRRMSRYTEQSRRRPRIHRRHRRRLGGGEEPGIDAAEDDHRQQQAPSLHGVRRPFAEAGAWRAGSFLTRAIKITSIGINPEQQPGTTRRRTAPTEVSVAAA